MMFFDGTPQGITYKTCLHSAHLRQDPPKKKNSQSSQFSPQKKSRDSKRFSFDIHLAPTHEVKCVNSRKRLRKNLSFNLATNGFIICRTLGMRPRDTHKIPPVCLASTKKYISKAKKLASMFEVPAKSCFLEGLGWFNGSPIVFSLEPLITY